MVAVSKILTDHIINFYKKMNLFVYQLSTKNEMSMSFT